MKLNEYQELAARTINKGLTYEQLTQHSLFEMCGEIGEIHSIYQKRFQGHAIDPEKLKLELGDLMWGIAEFCTAHGWTLDEVCAMNISKLRKRYPDGFSEERSLHREGT